VNSADSRPSTVPEPVGTRRHWHAITASYLGWTLDAFDFFIVVFLVDTLADQFGVAKSAIVWTITATLAMRPLGAIFFGMLADRYGRRKPLIANVIFFSLMELLSGFAPNYTVFLILRILFGIGMGGEWGLGASLALESSPPRQRGLISGILQSGYSAGYLLAAITARILLPTLGWRAMFWAGGAPALLALYIRWRVKESQAWKQHKAPGMRAILAAFTAFWKNFLYLVALMALMNMLSHGTQDLYPDFLKTAHGFSNETVSYLAMLYSVAAILGGILFGHWSQRCGRRRCMIAALVLALAARAMIWSRRFLAAAIRLLFCVFAICRMTTSRSASAITAHSLPHHAKYLPRVHGSLPCHVRRKWAILPHRFAVARRTA